MKDQIKNNKNNNPNSNNNNKNSNNSYNCKNKKLELNLYKKNLQSHHLLL